MIIWRVASWADTPPCTSAVFRFLLGCCGSLLLALGDGLGSCDEDCLRLCLMESRVVPAEDFLMGSTILQTHRIVLGNFLKSKDLKEFYAKIDRYLR